MSRTRARRPHPAPARPFDPRLERLETRDMPALVYNYATAGGTYTQDFNTLLNTGSGNPLSTETNPISLDAAPYNVGAAGSLDGWYYQKPSGGGTTNLTEGTGTSNAGGHYSLGVGSERALGSLRSGSYVPRMGMILVNTTGLTLTNFALNYTGETWRFGGGTTAADQLDFQYGFGGTALTISGSTGFLDINTLDYVGTITSGSTQSGSMLASSAISGSVTGFTWLPNERLVLRWNDFDKAGNEDVLAVDDISFQAYTDGTAPAVTTNPGSQTVAAGANATFTAAATGTPTPTVQWFESTNGGSSYSPLANNGTYSGVTTNTLTITGATAGMTGNLYRAVYSNTAGPPATTTAATLTVNTASATVSSIARNSPASSPTNAASVSWTVTFSAPVSGVTASNFTLVDVGTSITGEAITGVTPNGTAPVATWTVTANTGSGDGTLQLDATSATGISPAVTGLPVAGSGAQFDIDKTAPAVSIGAPTAAVTAGGPVSFDVTYSGASAVSLAPGNVTVTPTGGAAVGSVTVSGTGLTTRTVTLSGITGNGTVTISLAANTATDAAGNPAPATGPSTAVLVDNTAPAVSIGAPSLAATAGGPVSFVVTYTEANALTVTLAPGNVTVNAGGTATAGTVTVTGTGTTRTVTLSGITGDGTLGISLAANTATDGAGNPAAAAGPSATALVDNVAPTVSIGGPTPAATAAGPVSFTVTYADANALGITLAPGNVTVNATGTAAAGTVTVTGTGNTRTITLSGITGNGTLGVSIPAGTATDPAGNPAPAATSAATVAVDTTAPTVQTVARVGGPFTAATSVQYTVTFSEPVTGVTNGTFSPFVTGGLSGVAVSNVTGGPTTYTVTVATPTGDGAVRLDVPASAAVLDAAGNALVAAFASGDVTTIDRTAPTVSIGAPSATTVAGGPVSFVVTYADANPLNITLASANVTVNGTAAVGTVTVSGSGNTRTVTLSGITGNGTLGISLAANTASDGAGNPAPPPGRARP